MSDQDAQKIYLKYHPVSSALSDDELNEVTGGLECMNNKDIYEEIKFDTREEVYFIFNVGDIIEIYEDWGFLNICTTKECKITRTYIGCDELRQGLPPFYDFYEAIDTKTEKHVFNVKRSQIQIK